MKNKRQNKILYLLLIIFSIAVIASCGSGSSTTPDNTAPTVSSNSPANNAVDVAINSAVTATFSEALDPTTITTASFTLTDSSSNSVAGTVGYAGTTATFTPSSALAGNMTYTATITSGVKDAAGNAMANNYNWSFTTGTAQGATQPTVVETRPVDGANSVPTDATISVTFSEPMDPSSLNASTFIVVEWGGEGVIVPGTVAVNGATATFTPSSLLSSNAEPYQVRITTGATSLMGVGLAANYEFRFRISTPPPVMWDLRISNASYFGRVRDNLGQIDCGVASTDCTGSYQQGSTVQLTATALSGFQFLGWSGDLCGAFGTTSTISIVINGSSTCGANFAPIPGATFTMSIGTGNWVGRVTDSTFFPAVPGKIDCGTQVNVQTCFASYEAGRQIYFSVFPEPNAPAGTFNWRCTHPYPENLGDITYINPPWIWLTRNRTCFVELVPN